jgi:hypothetical protein
VLNVVVCSASVNLGPSALGAPASTRSATVVARGSGSVRSASTRSGRAAATRAAAWGSAASSSSVARRRGNPVAPALSERWGRSASASIAWSNTATITGSSPCGPPWG